MKKVKTNKLGRRILSIVLTAALVVGLMPGNMLTVSAEGIEAGKSEEIVVETVSSNDASSATECTCETDDPAFHATNCLAYIAPENPQCYCAEKCTEDTLNVWCDVCGMQGVSACQGEDTAVAYEIVENGTCGAEGNESSVTWSLDSDGTLTISGSGAMWDYSTGNGRAPWNVHKDNITTVIIEEGVTTIGTYAFWSCEQLTEITISATVTTIGNSAFVNCARLIQITVPQSVTSIGEFAFAGCSSLTSVTLPNSISTIQEDTFSNCKSLTSLTIPKGVTTIGPGAFYNCTSLNSITIPEGVTTIGDMAFYGCISLETIVIPSSVTTIGANVFNEVPGVSSEDGFLIINGILMKYTGNAANVEIPSGVTKINQRAFEDNQSIVTVKIPSGVTTLGSNAFFNCDSLVSVELPETLISMESSFIYCDGLKEITIPNGMKTIGRYAFGECTSLEKVKIPNSVTEIGDYAFENIAANATINAPCSWNENPLYTFADGITVNIPAHQNMTYSVNDEGNVINNECSNCGKVGGTLTINAEGGIYDETTKYGATVEKTGTLENAEVTVNYYQGDTLIGTDAPVNAGNYRASITFGKMTVYCEFEIAKATLYMVTAPTTDAITYGKTLKDSALSGGTVQYSETVVAGSWSWKEETTKPVVADSETTQYDVVFTPTDADNYNVLETKLTLTVNKSETTPNMPKSTMSVLYSKKTVGAVTLPEGWVWNDTDKATELPLEEEVSATATYNGTDKGNYVTENIEITLIRKDCTHEEGKEVLYTGEGEKAPTCTEAGIGHTECTKCQEPMQTKVSVKATGHTWDNGVVTKEPTAIQMGEKTYTCSVCKTTKTEEIPALGAPKVGTQEISDDGKATYKVTTSDLAKGTVTYVAPTNKKVATVTIPDVVVIDGVTYKVTAIEKKAFKNNKNIKKVTIGKNVKTIGKEAFSGCKKMTSISIGKNVSKIDSKAFYGCSKLKTLTIKSSKLTTKKIGSKAFSKTPKSMTVKVPKKKFKTYKSMFIKRGVNKKAKFKKS